MSFDLNARKSKVVILIEAESARGTGEEEKGTQSVQVYIQVYRVYGREGGTETVVCTGGGEKGTECTVCTVLGEEETGTQSVGVFLGVFKIATASKFINK
eukprot:5899156-Pyramimonas_sp.AAC.1